MTGLESRLTILGHLQRGGTPSATDRVLATQLGSACIRYIEEGMSGMMIAIKGETIMPIPLKDVVGKRKVVPRDHCWVESARSVGTCLGE
jgi:6-phosphofructokinase 1